MAAADEAGEDDAPPAAAEAAAARRRIRGVDSFARGPAPAVDAADAPTLAVALAFMFRVDTHRVVDELE